MNRFYGLAIETRKKSKEINLEEHYKLSDLQFEEEFKNCELSPALFTHEAHLRLTWLHIKHYGYDAAKKSIEHQIKSYVKHLGAEEKYHQTITLVAIGVVHQLMEKSKAQNFKEFIAEHSELKTNFKELINRHYSYDIFQSEKARVEYIIPDIIF